MLASGKHPSRESAPPLPPFYGLLNELLALFYIDDPTRPISLAPPRELLSLRFTSDRTISSPRLSQLKRIRRARSILETRHS